MCLLDIGDPDVIRDPFHINKPGCGCKTILYASHTSFYAEPYVPGVITILKLISSHKEPRNVCPISRNVTPILRISQFNGALCVPLLTILYTSSQFRIYSNFSL